MRNLTSRWIRFVAAAFLLGASGAMAQLPVVAGEPALAPKEVAPAPKLRIAPGEAPQVRLSPITDDEMAGLRQANRRSQKRLLIGVVRAIDVAAALLSARDMAWKPVEGGYAAQVAVNSPQAGAMRLAVDLKGVPADVEMVVFGSDSPDRLVGPMRVGSIADRMAPWWTPVTDGETQTLEFFAPGAGNPRALSLRIAVVSHIFTTLASAFKKRTSEIGEAGACNVDIKCSSLRSSQAFLNTRNAVAQMVFTDGDFTGLCTGTILNDTDATTQIPWLYGANHCFENENLPLKTAAQMQTVANTLNTLWFFEAISCNDLSVPPYIQVADGATYIYNNPGADVLFLRLNSSPPVGSYFTGWDANAISLGSSVITIHHPQGDLKKVTQGTVLRYSSPSVLGGASAPFTEVHWDLGTTESGSSGAGLWTFDGSQYLLRGGLWGGTALCENPEGTDNFSRFDQVYASLAPYLNPPPSPSADYTDMWWNPQESGWGVNVIQHPSKIIFAVWFTYQSDGTRTWLVLPAGTWTSSNTYSGTLYSTSGPAANAAFNAASVTTTPVGTGTLNFSDANNGAWSYSVNGVSGSRAITRQSF
jgi:lysyl endopeptidase